jgi:hypothetical protein
MSDSNFHDGYFDGFYLGRDKTVQLFVRTYDQRSYTMTLRGVKVMTLSEVKQGNIILDLAVRSAHGASPLDVAELYGVEQTSEQAAKLLQSTRETELQILQLDSSYGARGLILFERLEISEGSATPRGSLGSSP